MLRHCKGVLATCDPLMLMLTLAVCSGSAWPWKCCDRDRERRENPMKLKEEISEELARIESQLTRTGAGSLGGERRTPATQAQPTHVADVMNRGLVTVQPTDTVPAAAGGCGSTAGPACRSWMRRAGWWAGWPRAPCWPGSGRSSDGWRGLSRCWRTGPTHTEARRDNRGRAHGSRVGPGDPEMSLGEAADCWQPTFARFPSSLTGGLWAPSAGPSCCGCWSTRSQRRGAAVGCGAAPGDAAPAGRRRLGLDRALGIEASKGVLRLYGLVDGDEEKAALTTMARAIAGCSGVENHLVPKSQFRHRGAWV